MVPLKYLNNFWRTPEIPLINYEINLFLNWSKNCFIMAGIIDDQVPTFAITDMKFDVPVVTLSTNDYAQLLHQLKAGFKRAINWK